MKDIELLISNCYNIQNKLYIEHYCSQFSTVIRNVFDGTIDVHLRMIGMIAFSCGIPEGKEILPCELINKKYKVSSDELYVLIRNACEVQ